MLFRGLFFPLLIALHVSAQGLVNPHRTCSENSFCNRFRDWTRLPIDDRKIYHISDRQLKTESPGVYSVPIMSSRIEGLREPILMAELHFYVDNTVRLIVDENQDVVGERRTRYRIPSGDVVQDSQLKPHPNVNYSYNKEDRVSTFDLGDSTTVQLDHNTVVISLSVDGRVIQTINEKQMFQIESTRRHYGDPCPFDLKRSSSLYLDPACTPKVQHGAWAEEYRGLTDYKPYGPSSVAVDITFHGRVPALYGLPEKGTRSLKLKIDGDADNKLYRFFNLGYAAYSVESTVSTVVFNESTSPARSSVLWVNPSDTYIALLKNEDDSVHSWFLSESGVIDLFLFPQRTPIAAMKSYHDVVGYAPLPPYFSLGFHRSHYSYESQEDILGIVDNYTKYNIPVDVYWLDIEHTNGKQYFTWNTTLFPDPLGMVKHVNSLGKEVVTIVDPHLKASRSYPIFLDGFCKDVYVKERYFCHLEGCLEHHTSIDGYLRGAEERMPETEDSEQCKSHTDEVFKGLCWPGISAWPDFTAPRVREWWSELFKPDGINEYFYTWNDMNEPAVFEDMEMTMNRDLVHAGDIEHRDVHNAYGHYFRMASFEGHLKYRRPGKRPFILTRSFYLGSHMYGPMWNGDSLSQWDNLQAVLPMFITLSAPGGYSFSGSDVGGFTGQPSSELLVRWNQLAAATSVFYRLHSDIVSPPRDPWHYDNETIRRFRDAVHDRYELLPFWYTLFARYSMFGEPMLRPLWFDYLHDTNTYDAKDKEYDAVMDQEVVLGTDILVRGVTEDGVTSVGMYFPAGTQWYNENHEVIDGGALRSVNVTLDAIPRFYRAGSIIPRKECVRDSTKGTQNDPITLWVFEDPQTNTAEGYVYLDDGSSFDSISVGQFALYKLSFNHSDINIHRASGHGDFPLLIGQIKVVTPNGVSDGVPTAGRTSDSNPMIIINFEDETLRVSEDGSLLAAYMSFSLSSEARVPSEDLTDIPTD
ncbi:hypothetical protein FOL47_008636 [Perkinsus chesapeaki]|uniref:Neutral alpha-glucosidase AB n=1 Tax=Perkinsus chesapeaki TaxID=330153 RepID=A0A7J6LCX2_PERCH|nr:hypothetical protein FOL47_008636 [Perkinsus chesapeaki]